MSYEIIYDKQFIKLPNKQFVPVIYAGSNNCYEWSNSGKERRARSWWNWSWLANNKLFATEEEMVMKMEDWRKDIIERNAERNAEYRAKGDFSWVDNYDDSNFGYFSSIAIVGKGTHKTTYGMVKGIVTTGCRKALTVEQLKDEGISVSVSSYTYSEDEIKKAGLEPLHFVPATSEELLEFLSTTIKPYLDKKIYISVSLNGAWEERMTRIRKKYFPRTRKEKKLIEVDHFFTVVAPNGNYLVKRTRRGYQYTYYPYLKYATEKEAQRRAKSSGGTVKRIDEKTNLYTNV